MTFPIKKALYSLKETEEFAKEISELLVEGDTVIFNGDLGSGKTTFIRFICKYYDIRSVVSPSFSIVNEYCGEKKVYHFDFYRIKKVGELYDIGFDDYINDSEAIVLIEWGYLIREILPKEHYEILIETFEGEQRIITISKRIM